MPQETRVGTEGEPRYSPMEIRSPNPQIGVSSPVRSPTTQAPILSEPVSPTHSTNHPHETSEDMYAPFAEELNKSDCSHKQDEVPIDTSAPVTRRAARRLVVSSEEDDDVAAKPDSEHNDEDIPEAEEQEVTRDDVPLKIRDAFNRYFYSPDAAHRWNIISQ